MIKVKSQGLESYTSLSTAGLAFPSWMKAEFSGHIDYSSVTPAQPLQHLHVSTTDQNVKLTTTLLIDGEHEIFMRHRP